MDQTTRLEGEDHRPHRENRILAALPLPERRQLLDAATEVTLSVRTVLFEPGGAIDAVYFPTDGVISLVTPLQSGAIVEVATIGNEGIVGIPLVLPLTGFAVRAITQVAGHGLRLDAAAFVELTGQSRVLQVLVDRYTQALFGQILSLIHILDVNQTGSQVPLDSVLAVPGLSLQAITEAGAQRVSVGGKLVWVAVQAMAAAAVAIRNTGDLSVLSAKLPLEEWFR